MASFSSSCYAESYAGVIEAVGKAAAEGIKAYKDPEGPTKKDYNNVTTINESSIENGVVYKTNMGNKISGKDVKATNVYMRNKSSLKNGAAIDSNIGNDI